MIVWQNSSLKYMVGRKHTLYLLLEQESKLTKRGILPREACSIYGISEIATRKWVVLYT